MNSALEIGLRAVLIGIGGTIALDAWAQLLQRGFGIPATSWALVGRWLGHMPSGKFVHASIAQAAPVSGERALGWGFHYGIGIGYGLLLVALWGADWLRQPDALAPVMLSLALLVAPYFVMMPGLGLGLAGSKTPQPNITRLKSVAGHTVFGLGMYATALMLAADAG